MVPMTFTRTMRRLHRTEAAFALSLEQLAERHRAEAEVHHVAKDLAPWSRRHLHDLSSDARRHGLRLAAAPGRRPGHEPTSHDSPPTRRIVGSRRA